MYKVFCIGNSLTADTTRFFTEIAEHEEGYSKCVAMLIGGMTLDGHVERLLASSNEHEIYTNGISTRFKSSIGEALASDKWDYILLQQAYSRFGPEKDVSEHYKFLAHYFKMAAPNAKVILLNTWAPYYLDAETPDKDRMEKFSTYEQGVKKAAMLMGLGESAIVPAGKVIEALMQKGIDNLYRDEVHLTLSLGRYAAAQTLYSYLSGKKAKGNTFRTFTGPRTEEDFLFDEQLGVHFPKATEEDILTVQQTVDEILGF